MLICIGDGIRDSLFIELQWVQTDFLRLSDNNNIEK